VTLEEAIERAQAELEVQIRRCVEGMGMTEPFKYAVADTIVISTDHASIFTKVLAMGSMK
jgi:hypothetical protein